MAYLIKEPEDLRKLLSVPYVPHPFEASGYHEADRNVGERGIVDRDDADVITVGSLQDFALERLGGDRRRDAV